MTEEDRIAHDAFSAALIASMAPEGALELQFAQRIAADSWRLNRASAIEDNLFALGFSSHSDDETTGHPEVDAALTAARTFTREAKSFELLTLYEQRLNRSVQKNLAQLQALQSARKAEGERQMEEAARLLELNEMKGLAYEPAQDGFVFSITRIRAALDRKRRLAEVRNADPRRQKPDHTYAKAA
jgi:hypothetical protein